MICLLGEGCTVRDDCSGQWLDGHSVLCLLIWQATFFSIVYTREKLNMCTQNLVHGCSWQSDNSHKMGTPEIVINRSVDKPDMESHTEEYYSAVKKDGVLTLTAT